MTCKKCGQTQPNNPFGATVHICMAGMPKPWESEPHVVSEPDALTVYRRNQQLEAENAALAGNYAGLAEMLFGESEYDHASVYLRLSDILNENDALRQQLSAVHDDLCENGHASHAECTSDCACVGQGQSRMEKLEAENAALKTELETERMRLAACSVAALSNTDKTVAERIGPGHPYYSASYSDVCRAVDREMALRNHIEALDTAREYDRFSFAALRQERDAALALMARHGDPQDADESLGATPLLAKLAAHERDREELRVVAKKNAGAAFAAYKLLINARSELAGAAPAGDAGAITIGGASSRVRVDSHGPAPKGSQSGAATSGQGASLEAGNVAESRSQSSQVPCTETRPTILGVAATPTNSPASCEWRQRIDGSWNTGCGHKETFRGTITSVEIAAFR